MKEEEKQKLKKELVEIYQGYIKNNKDNDIRSRAQKLFFDYIYNNDILDRDLMIAIHGLEHIGWEFSRGLNSPNSQWKMKEDEAEQILNKIK